jgi:hypothetical protein
MTLLAVGFLVIVLGVAAALLLGLRAAGGPSVAAVAALFLLAWMALTGALAAGGAIALVDGRPPLLFGLVWVAAALIVAGLRTAAGRRALAATPAAWIIALQVFRVAVELVLWRLHHAGLVPRRMTFEGRNFDVAVGLTAPLVAWLVARGRVGRAGQAVWHLASLSLLVNVVSMAVLSAPGPLRHFRDDVPLVVVGRLPWVWLPTVLVPVALMSHLVSLVRLWRRPSAGGNTIR